nr:tetratricopeptide repeat protein [Ardenticatena sp.]
MMLAQKWQQLTVRGRIGLLTLCLVLVGVAFSLPHARENWRLVRAVKAGVPEPVPDDAPPALHLLAANSAFDAEDWERAAHHWEIAVRDARTAFPAWLGLCRVALRRLDEQAARTYCLSERVRSFWLLMEAKALWRATSREPAILAARLVTERDPKNGEAWSVLAAYLLAVERYEEALVANERAMALNPNAPWLYERHARILINLERLDEASQLLNEAIARFPDSSGLYYLAADVARKREDTDTAWEWYARITERWPDEWRAWNMLGGLARKQGDWATALAAFRHAVEAGANSPWVWYSYAESAWRMEQDAEAERVLDAIWPLEPPPNLQISIARLYRELGAEAKAEQTLDRVATLDIPPDWQLGVARLYRDMGLVEKARQSYERVLAADPQHETARKELDALEQSP